MSNLLNIKDEQGNWIPIPVVTNGIASITHNDNYTLTIMLEDGTTYTTSSIRGEKGAKGDKGDKGDTGNTGSKGDKGDKGDAFTYSDFTPEQLASLKGEKGDKGDTGEISLENLYPHFITNTASGTIASFEDGADNVPMKDVKIQIEPVQDLHGYDNPWPAGGGKNKCPHIQNTTFRDVETSTDSSGKTTVSGTATGGGGRLNLCTEPFILEAGTYTISHNGTGTWGDALVISAVGGSALYQLSNSILYYVFTLSEQTAVVVGISITNGTVYNGTISPQIESGSGKTSFAPYSNICPISGWTGCNVSRTGVNVWDEEWVLGFYNARGIFVANQQGYMANKNPIPIVSNITYCISIQGTTTQTIYACWYDSDMSFVKRDAVSLQSGIRVLTSPQNAKYMCFATETFYGTTYNHDISINYPSTDHDYHPYTGNLYPITFPQEAGTVYGGTLDVTIGELVVDMAIVDLGTMNWVVNTSSEIPYFYATISGYKFISLNPNCLCSRYAAARVGSTGSAEGFFITDTNLLRVRDTAYSDAATFKTAMSGVQLVYELAEPIHYTLDPVEIRSLLGQNNLFSDTGNTTAEYRADTKLYIQKKITEAVSALT